MIQFDFKVFCLPSLSSSSLPVCLLLFLRAWSVRYLQKIELYGGNKLISQIVEGAHLNMHHVIGPLLLLLLLILAQ